MPTMRPLRSVWAPPHWSFKLSVPPQNFEINVEIHVEEKIVYITIDMVHISYRQFKNITAYIFCHKSRYCANNVLTFYFLNLGLYEIWALIINLESRFWFFEMRAHNYFGPSLVSYPRPMKYLLSLSHDEIGQSPPSFTCYLN